MIQRKPAGSVVASMKCGLMHVEPIKVANEPLQSGMPRLIEKVPFDLAVMGPFVLLRDLAAHEQELFAGMRPHKAEVGAQIG